MTDWTKYDPRRLRETLDLLDTTVTMLGGLTDAVAHFAKGQPDEAFASTTNYLMDAINDCEFTMSEIRDALPDPDATLAEQQRAGRAGG